uniref:Cement protein 100k n=1 Tax=Amphibalanus amphitrite TaxID=1232801 RepID=S5RQ27_AMPAM|nr:cement protein 100k [Amphibalanus amphitrite]
MLRLPLALALLLAASAYGNVLFARSGCGCLRNPVAAKLTGEEISHLRGYVKERGVKHYDVLSNDALQAIFRFNLINNFPDVVPATRTGVLQIISESLNTLTDAVVPSVPQCGKIAGYLQKSVPGLAAGGVSLDLRSLVASASVILHQRGVTVNLEQLNVLLKSGLAGYLQSTAYQSSYGSLIQLISALDHIDHNLPNILDQESLIVVRRALESRFNLDREIFDKRYKLAIKAFEENRRRLLASFNTLAYRGPNYETNVQLVIKQMLTIFSGISAKTVRIILNILQLTNSAGGKATPKDLLAMITVPKLDVSIRKITEAAANRVYLKLPEHHQGLTIDDIQEAYSIFIIGLASQGVQPLQLEATYEAFIWHTQRFFLATRIYSVQAYLLYVMRVVVPLIPRGSQSFRLHIFDSSVVIDNILVPEGLTSIYEEGRQTIIKRIRGLQGSSSDITNRIIGGQGEKGVIGNDLKFQTIVPADVPGYDQFEYQNVILSAVQMREIASVLIQRFNQLKQPSLQLPLMRIMIHANVIPNSGAAAAAAFRRLFRGLPAYSGPTDLSFVLTQLSENRLQLTETQLLAGIQQFYVASRCLGYVIPQQTIPSVFLYTVREYLSTLASVPAQPFGDGFLEFLYLRLAGIIRQVTVVDQKVPIDDYVSQKIFSVFGSSVRISVEARRTIIRFIHNSELLPKVGQGVSVVAQYQRLLKSLFKRYPIGTFILSTKELVYIRAELKKAGISVDIKYLRDANVMAYIGLGLLNRLEKSMTVIRVRQIVLSSIRYFLRINKVSNIPSVEFFRVLLHQYKVPLPQLPLPKRPVIQYPKYTRAPIYILSGISLPVKQVEQLVVILRTRFVFVSIENVQSILAHTVLLLRASGQQIVQKNCYEVLTRYYRGLPKSISVGEFDIEDLVKEIDDQLKDATISGTGVQSALVELYLHMYYLKMPLPSVKVRDGFLSFVIGAYGKVQVRRQLPFGKLFYDFLQGFLPKLPGYLKPFPIFAGPQVYKVFHSTLKTPVYPSDIPLYFQLFRRVTKGSLTMGSLQSSLSGLSLLPGLTSEELSSIIDLVKGKQLKVSQTEIRRAFAICRLSLGLSSVKISRSKLISIFQEVVISIVQKYKSLLVVSYVEQILLRIRTYGPKYRPVQPITPIKPGYPCKNSKYIRC